eukprot:jgi/Tetstr1/442372/TSEL_030498.t1
MDIDAHAWPPAGVEAADEGVIREGDPGDFYMKVIAKKFRGVWHYGVITGVTTEWVLEDYGGATQWRAVFEDGDIVDLLRSEVVEAMAAAHEHPPVDADGEARLATVHEGDDQSIMKCSAHVKSKNSNNSADSDWQLLHDIMPAGFTWGGMAVPRSHEAMRKFLRGCVAFSGAPGKAGGWANLPDQHYPECNADRFIRMPAGGAREDAKYTTMVARAQHFYLNTPPPPPGADSDDNHASARPIGQHCEALVLLDGPGIRKVAVLMAHAHMSSANAADLGVDAKELLVAGIHARSQDAARAFSEASHTAARVASWKASLTWRNSALTAAVVGQGTAR